MPNPSGVFGVGLPIVYYYFEVYGIPQKTDDSSFTVGYQVRDSFGDVHKDYSKRRKKFGNSSVEVADLMLQDKGHKLETLIVKLAQKGRAAGIFMVLRQRSVRALALSLA